MNQRRKPKSKLGLIIEHYLADIRHFFRHGLNRRLQALQVFLGFVSGDLKHWFQTREARRKFAKLERERQAEKLRTDAKLSLADFFKSLGGLLIAPLKFPRWAWRGIQELRKMSFREACQEIWMGYRTMIAKGLNFWEYHLNRMRRYPLWLRSLVILALMGVVVGLISSPFLLDTARQYRSQMMLTEARELDDDGFIIQAYHKARTAALLQPDNEEAREYILDLAEQVRTPEAVWWAERVAQAKDYDAESLAKVIELATLFGRTKLGLKYLGMLKDQYPDDPFITDAEIRVLMSQGRRMDALIHAGAAYRDGEDSKVIHQMLAQHYLAASDPVSRAEMADYLSKNLYREDDVGLIVMGMVLAHYNRLSVDDRALVDLNQLIDHARSNPEAESELRLLALGRAFEGGELSADETIAVMLEELDPSDPEERQDILNYARNFGLYGVVGHMPESARKEYADLKLEGLLMADEHDRVALQAMLDEARQIGVTPHAESFARAIIAQRDGNAGQFSEQLVRALDATELKDWAQLEKQALMILDHPQILEFYRESLRGHPDNAQIVSRGLSYAYQMGADAEIALWARELPMTTFRRDPYNQVFLIYLKALHERDLATIRYFGEQLIARNPREPLYYLVVAFAYAQSGDPELAASVLRAMNIDLNYDNLPPFLRVCLAKTGQPAAVEGLDLKLARERTIMTAEQPGEG